MDKLLSGSVSQRECYDELYRAWDLASRLLPDAVRALLFEYPDMPHVPLEDVDVDRWKGVRKWEAAIVPRLLDYVEAGPKQTNVWGEDRYACPLCHYRGDSGDGLKLEGLRRHLAGWGGNRCDYLHLTRVVARSSEERKPRG